MPETPLIGSFGFTGELQQGSDVWLRARWYGAGRGSFGSREPWAGEATRPYSLMPYQYAYANPSSWSDPTGQAVKTGSEQDMACTLAIFGQCLANYVLHPSDSRRTIAKGGTTLIAFLDRHAAVARVYTIDTDSALRARLGQEYYDMVRADFYAWRTQDRIDHHDTPSANAAFNQSVAASGKVIAFGAINQATENLNLSGSMAAKSVCQPPSPNRRLQEDIYPDESGPIDVKNAPYIVGRPIRDRDWPVWGTRAGSTEAGDFTSLAQSRTVQEALSHIPKTWAVTQQEQGVGYVFTNPNANALVTEVRIKVPMAKFNPDWKSFAQLRLGKYVGTVAGDPKYGMIYYDRSLNITKDNNAMHIRLEFDP